MKCPKCGFESQSKFCPECGTPMQAPPQPAPDQSIPPTPTPTPYGQPPLNPTNNNPAKRVSPPPRGRKPTVIVIAIIVALVVLAGIVIAVGSGIFYHKTLINATTERKNPDIIEQPYDYQQPDYLFDSLNTTGEPYDFDYGTLTLTSVTNKDGDYTFSGELLNSTELPQSYIIKDIRFSLNDSPDFTIQFDKKTRDGEKYNSTEFLLEPGEKTTFAFTAKGPKESGETDFSVYVQFYNSVGILSELEVNYDLHKTDIK